MYLTIRTKLLVLFTGLAVLPLVALGVVFYLSLGATQDPVAHDAGFRNFWIAISCVALALALFPLFANRIWASIRALTQGAEAIAAGDLFLDLEVKSRDEIGLLANSINRVVARYRETSVALHDLTLELEDRVARRIADIEGISRAIREENRQLALELADREREIGRVLDGLRTTMAAEAAGDDMPRVVAAVERCMIELDVDLSSPLESQLETEEF